ncbi:disulfide bond formation protein B [Candidatus Parcubacteria bacterium]|nr:disulfide bond formation protein B [Candidatus Parcubacteria bacterium]
MTENFITVASTLTVVADILIVYIVFAFFLRDTPHGKYFLNHLGRYGNLYGFIVALSALVASLIFSNIIGFTPCELCWVQRIFLYSQVPLLGLALWKRDTKISDYSIILSVLGFVVALYHSYTQLGGHSLTACTTAGGACSKIYFVEWGYVTIPSMALTAFALLLLFMIAQKRHAKTL